MISILKAFFGGFGTGLFMGIVATLWAGWNNRVALAVALEKYRPKN